MDRTRTILLAGGVVVLVLCAGVLFLAANYHTIHALSICSRCGARVVTDTHYFTWSTRPAGDVDTIISTRPTILSEMFNESSACSHGGFVGIANGKLSGPQAGNYLILIESRTQTLLGRFRSYQHATGIGKGVYDYYFKPGDPVNAGNPAFDFARFRNFLLKKKQLHPEFPEQFRKVMQTEHPNNNKLAKDLVDELLKIREGSNVKQ